jgi:hypothetical protein
MNLPRFAQTRRCIPRRRSSGRIDAAPTESIVAAARWERKSRGGGAGFLLEGFCAILLFMEMKLITSSAPIQRSDLKAFSAAWPEGFVKAVVDLERQVMVVGGDLHADEEAVLLNDGSRQNNLWGINFYPDAEDETWIEFDSMINIRPSQGNRSRSVEDQALRARIREVVAKLVRPA